MKNHNGLRAGYDAFLLHVIQVGCVCVAIFGTLKERINGPQLFYAVSA